MGQLVRTARAALTYGPTPSPRDGAYSSSDDNEDVAESLAELLKDLGHDEQTASGGLGALRMVSAFRPEACPVDIGLPATDQYELAQRLHESQDLPSGARVVALADYGHDADEHRTAKAGFHAHLVKPVCFAQLTEIVAS